MKTQLDDDLSVYLSGKRLYGDDFSIEQIREWYADEEEGYAHLGAKDRGNYEYEYHQLNITHGYRYLGSRQFSNTLGFGSAYGDELKPIANRIEHLTILDPSASFADSNIQDSIGVRGEYVQPSPDGTLAFADQHFALITCFGVMHHVPNVSYVLSECYRCLADEGIMLLREPINSMGDWRQPRAGLTKRERGIPIEVLDSIVENAGFRTRQRHLCDFSPIPLISSKFGVTPYNNRVLTYLDSVLSNLFSWNIKYHRTSALKKIAPSSVFYVLERQS